MSAEKPIELREPKKAWVEYTGEDGQPVFDLHLFNPVTGEPIAGLYSLDLSNLLRGARARDRGDMPLGQYLSILAADSESVDFGTSATHH